MTDTIRHAASSAKSGSGDSATNNRQGFWKRDKYSMESISRRSTAGICDVYGKLYAGASRCGDRTTSGSETQGFQHI